MISLIFQAQFNLWELLSPYHPLSLSLPLMFNLYSLSIFEQGCSHPCIIMSFEVCRLSLSFTPPPTPPLPPPLLPPGKLVGYKLIVITKSSLFKLIIPVPYLTVPTGRAFKTLMILSRLKLDFNTIYIQSTYIFPFQNS